MEKVTDGEGREDGGGGGDKGAKNRAQIWHEICLNKIKCVRADTPEKTKVRESVSIKVEKFALKGCLKYEAKCGVCGARL